MSLKLSWYRLISSLSCSFSSSTFSKYFYFSSIYSRACLIYDEFWSDIGVDTSLRIFPYVVSSFERNIFLSAPSKSVCTEFSLISECDRVWLSDIHCLIIAGTSLIFISKDDLDDSLARIQLASVTLGGDNFLPSFDSFYLFCYAKTSIDFFYIVWQFSRLF